jgi:RimJ/RimL family protein N-acetyltransferase
METPESIPTRRSIPSTELKTERLLLRPWRAEDADSVYRICQDPEIQRWTSVPSPYELSDAETFVRRIVPDGLAYGTDAVFGIFERETGIIAGAIDLHGITAEDVGGMSRVRQAELGYWANPETRGQGYLTEATREVIRWGFDELGLKRIRWQAFDGNAASRRVAEKAGFTMVGLQRGSHLHRGTLCDMWLADMLPTDPRP